MKQPVNRDLAWAVREFRSQNGLTQEQLGKRLGLHQTMIANVEAGRRKSFSRRTARRVSKILQQPLLVVLGFEAPQC